MDPEVLELMKRSLKKKTFFDKIKHRLLLWKTTDSQVDEMRKQLIREVKPIFSSYCELEKEDSAFNKLRIDYFEERIRSLPKEDILELFSYLEDLLDAESDETKEYVLLRLIFHINLLYSVDGWFSKKLSSLRL